MFSGLRAARFCGTSHLRSLPSFRCHAFPFSSSSASPSKPVVYRKDYTPPPHVAERIELSFDLGLQDTRVVTKTRYRRAKGGVLSLDGNAGLAAMKLHKVIVNGKVRIVGVLLASVDISQTCLSVCLSVSVSVFLSLSVCLSLSLSTSFSLCMCVCH